MITFHPTKPDLDRVKALAASGSSGVSRKYLAELQRMVRLDRERSKAARQALVHQALRGAK